MKKNMNDIEKIIPKYSQSDIEKFDYEDRFMEAYVELLKQSIELLYKIVGIRYCDENGIPQKINKEEAVIGGNLTRLIKLNTSFLQNICERRLEICYILSRCIAETAINTKFMLLEGEERVKRNFIKHSLITEKELWDTILSNIENRGGDVLPIEERMRISIQNSFDKSDFEMDDVSRSSKWKSIKSRADLVAGEMFYSVFYGLSSHTVHGNWQDILFNHLNRIEDGFELNLDWNNPKPQIIDGPILLNFDITSIFCDKEITDEENKKLIKNKCRELAKYLKLLSQSHENWYQKTYQKKLDNDDQNQTTRP
jgi:hypothetical protein